MRFAWLGSGSRGNAALIQAGRSCVMLDCGLPLGETERRLARLGVAPGEVDAVLVTHEHGDHVAGVARFARRHDVAVYATVGTARALGPVPELRIISPHESFPIGDLELHPMPVPHDAREPCQFVFCDGDARLGVLTDLGRVTSHVIECLVPCDALALECNHDEALLAAGPYPAALKRRVGGPQGHLSNSQAAALLMALGAARLKHLVAVHLSETNNTPDLAREALAGAAGCAPAEVAVADQLAGLDWRSL